MTHSIAIPLGGLLVNATAVILTIVPYFPRPGVTYSTNAITAFPITYRDNKPAPGEIQGKAMVNGPIMSLAVVVSNSREVAANAWVQIPLSKSDDYLTGWMTESDAPSIAYMLGGRTKYSLKKLLPGDSVTFHLNLGNVRSDIASRIRVFDGDGRPAAHYQYVAVRDLGSDSVLVPFKTGWIYLLVLMLVTVLVSFLWIRRLRYAALSKDAQRPADATENPSNRRLNSTAPDQTSRDRPPSDGTSGSR